MTALIPVVEKSNISLGLKNFEFMAWLSVLVLGPFREEVSFRLWCSMKRWQVAVGIAAFIFSLSGFGFECILPLLYKIGIESTYTCTWIRFALALLISALIGYAFYSYIDQKLLLKIRSRRKIYLALLFAGCLFFALLHMTNYQLDSQVFIFALISTLPQFVGSICFTYVRLNLGFFPCLIFHSVINGIFALPGVLS